MSFAAIGTIATVGLGVAGAAGAFDPDIQQRDIGRETRDTLQARLDLADPLRALTSEDALANAATNRRILLESLLGTAGGTVRTPYNESQTYWLNERTGQETLTQPALAQQAERFGRGQRGDQWVQKTRTITKYRDEQQPASRGLLDIYQKDILPAAHSAERAGQANRVALLGEFGPQYIAALKSANPEQTALRDRLVADAQTELDAGASLTPEERRRAEQVARASAARRGLGWGSGDAIAEATNVALTGEARRDARRRFAASAIGLDQSLYGDPHLQLFGTPSGSTPVAGSLFNMGASTGNTGRQDPFDPFNAYGNAVGDYNANARNGSAIQGANSMASGVTGALRGLNGFYRAGVDKKWWGN